MIFEEVLEDWQEISTDSSMPFAELEPFGREVRHLKAWAVESKAGVQLLMYMHIT